jgi:hypothetical protein
MDKITNIQPIETFEIQSSPNDKNVCKMNPMRFVLLISVFMILLYIVQFKIN